MRKIQLLAIGMIMTAFSLQAQNGREASMESNGRNESPGFFFSKEVAGTMQEVNELVVKALKAEKFGVITEIDMAKTLKEKIDVDMNPYIILGVCNPGFAYEAIQAEPNIGVFLPCKVILKQLDENRVEVVSINPEAMMKMLGNEKLNKTATEVGEKLEKVIMSL